LAIEVLNWDLEICPLTLRHNNAVQIHGKLKPRNLKIPELLFAEILTIVRGWKGLHRVKFWGKYGDQFLRKWGQSSKFAPYISETGGSWGSKFLSPIGDRGV